MPTQENILAFWNQLDDLLIFDEMVLTKMSIAARKTIQSRPPNFRGYQFTVKDCKEWYFNPSITKAVLSHLVSVKEGNDDTDIMRHMNL